MTTEAAEKIIKDEIQCKTFYDLRECNNRISVHQGGTRSGKTYSILKILIEFAYSNINSHAVISIVRKTMPSLRMTVYRDFIAILTEEGLYDESYHNKSENTYHIGTVMFEFFSVDQAQKVRGSKRHILFMNEANEFTFEEFFQLNIRTVYKAILDYNPSIDDAHWILSKVLVRKDARRYITTYLDNPYLTKNEIKEIEQLKHTDAYYWSIYGLGMEARNPSRVFDYTTCEHVPSKAVFVAYGLDFGFTNDPTAVTKVFTDMNTRPLPTLYVDEILYERRLTNDDISKRLSVQNVSKRDYIICDNAEPKSIEELKRLGWRVRPARKGRDSIQASIQRMKQYRIVVTQRSTNVITEFNNYKYKQDSNGTTTNEIVDMFNHAIDGIRYVALTKLRRRGAYAVM